MRHLIFAVSIIMAALALPSTAAAAPAEQACAVGAFRQHDMAGTYVSQTMALTIYPCGGSYLTWTNGYGQHAATYVTVRRVAEGGVVARGYLPDPMTGGYLDSSIAIGYKPAEPGWVEVITVNDYSRAANVYRLIKIE